MKGHNLIVSLLIQIGADLNLKTKVLDVYFLSHIHTHAHLHNIFLLLFFDRQEGRSALDYARMCGKGGCVRLLEQVIIF